MMRCLLILIAWGALAAPGTASPDPSPIPAGDGYDFPVHPVLPEESGDGAVDTRGTAWANRQQPATPPPQQQEAARQATQVVHDSVDAQARVKQVEGSRFRLNTDFLKDLERRAAMSDKMRAGSPEAIKEWSNKAFSEGPGPDALKPPPMSPRPDYIFKGRGLVIKAPPPPVAAEDLNKRKEKGVRIYIDPRDLSAVMAKSEEKSLEMVEAMDRDLVAGGDAFGSLRNLKRRLTRELSAGKIVTKLGFQKMPWSGVNEPLAAVSLRNLLQAPARNGELPEEARTVGHLKRVLGYLLDSVNDDVVLLGVPGDKDEKPSMLLDDLTDALRTAWLQDLKPGCSLDPDPKDPGGKQKVRVFGVPKNSNFAKVMLDADYEMKKINMGLIKFESDPIPGFVNSFELQLRRIRENPNEQGNVNSRFWLTPTRPEPGDLMVEPGRRFMMFQSRVSLMTEAMAVSGDALTGTGKVNAVDDMAARIFTAHYEAIEQRRVVFRRLHALFDLVMLSQILRENGVASALLRRIADRETRTVDVADAYDGVSRTETVEGTNVRWTVQGGVMVYLKLRRKYFRDLEQRDLQDLEAAVLDSMCGRTVSVSESPALKQLLKDRLRVEKEKRDADLFFERGQEKSFRAEAELGKGGEAAARPLFEEAERFFTKAIDKDDDFPEACCQRALVRWRLKKYKDAIADCDLSAKKDPDLWTSYWIRSKVRSESGDREGADADWARYRELVAKDKFLKELLSTTRN